MSEPIKQELWDRAVANLRSSLKTESEIGQMDRYFPMFLSRSINGSQITIEVADEIQVQWFTDIYEKSFANAFRLVGGPSDATVKFVISNQETPTLPKPKPISPEIKNSTSSPSSSNSHRRNVRMLSSTLALDDNYTFDKYVRGPANSLSYAAASAVAKNPGRGSYNPLFIYGQTGLGKTHLMQAIGHRVMENLPGTTVCYITAETFLNEYVNALQDDKITDFRARYRQFDVLLIDDVQFIAGKPQIQEEFFNTFNSLLINHKQVVMTSDVKPQDLSGIESRLISRFQGGMVTEIESPSVETRLAIIKMKAELAGHVIDPDILNFIAENIKSHVRALEGALRRIIAFKENCPDIPLTVEVVKHILKDSIETEKTIKDISVEEIQKVTAAFYGVTVNEILSSERTQGLVTPRQVSMFISRKLCTKSLPVIGKAFNKTHATVLHGAKTIQDRIQTEEQLRAQVVEIVQKLGRKPSDVFES